MQEKKNVFVYRSYEDAAPKFLFHISLERKYLGSFFSVLRMCDKCDSVILFYLKA